MRLYFTLFYLIGAKHFHKEAINTKKMSGVWALTDLTWRADTLYKNKVLTNEEPAPEHGAFSLVQTSTL